MDSLLLAPAPSWLGFWDWAPIVRLLGTAVAYSAVTPLGALFVPPQAQGREKEARALEQLGGRSRL